MTEIRVEKTAADERDCTPTRASDRRDGQSSDAKCRTRRGGEGVTGAAKPEGVIHVVP